jgi:anti-sigma factor RsiW
MKEQHLTDDQIQEYLDGKISLPSTDQDHLRSCPHCKQTLSDYQGVATILNSSPAPQLSKSFADQVMARISTEETIAVKAEQKWATVGYVASAFSIIAAVVVVFILFIDKNVLNQWISTVLSPFQAVQGTLKSSFSQQLAELGISPTLLLSTALTIMIIAVADRAIVFYRRTHRLFSLMM